MNHNQKLNKFATQISVSAALVVFSATVAPAAQFILSIDGTDAIFLAGRDDITVPSPSDPWTGPGDYLVRHNNVTPEEAMETHPSSIPVATGDTVKVADPAVGGINFFNGFGPPFFGPEGNSPTSSLTSLGDLSGYLGTQGALAGVFLDDSTPSGSSPPATLDFSTAASRDFLSLSPGLGQVFFIGDGQTSGGTLQEFVAPTGATRLFFGIPDGFGFNGLPEPTTTMMVRTGSPSGSTKIHHRVFRKVGAGQFCSELVSSRSRWEKDARAFAAAPSRTESRAPADQ